MERLASMFLSIMIDDFSIKESFLDFISAFGLVTNDRLSSGIAFNQIWECNVVLKGNEA
jgi:hypothetical protein